jgi:hypothetical protein
MPMKYFTFILLMCLYGNPLFAQEADDCLHSYHKAGKSIYGYKDAKGSIKIPAQFEGLPPASKFRNIVAVTEAASYKSYYLLRNGHKVGRDSVYVFDMTYDCEQEGMIRFRDPKGDKVGFLGKDGKVVIPAVYNDAGPFHNGLALVLHDGKRICADGTPYIANACEHWIWEGTTALINDRGDVVADSIHLTDTENLNWYSYKTRDGQADTTIYTSLKVKGDRYLTFINYQKEFTNWFYQYLLNGLPAGNLSDDCFEEVTVEELWKRSLRKRYSKASFSKKYVTLLQERMSSIKQKKVELFIVREELNAMIFESKAFQPYYTDCGEPNSAQFPAFEVITENFDTRQQTSYQEHFSFLRTAKGYKLIAIALGPHRSP